jgi:hypothetical protein
MLFFRRRKGRSAVPIAILSSLAFIAAAVWAWDLPLATVGHFFLITLVLTVGLMLLAAVAVLGIKWLQKVLGKR